MASALDLCKGFAYQYLRFSLWTSEPQHLDSREYQPIYACYLTFSLAFVSTRGQRKGSTPLRLIENSRSYSELYDGRLLLCTKKG